MRAVDLDEFYREQIEHYCAATRYSIFREQNNDDDDIRATSVEWSDIAEGTIASE